MPKFEIKPEDGRFTLYVNGVALGSSKSDSDARFHMYALERMFHEYGDTNYDRGYSDGLRQDQGWGE